MAEVGDEVETLRRIGVDHVLAPAELTTLTETLSPSAPAPGQEEEPPRGEPGERDAASGSAPPPSRVLVVWGPAGAPGRTTVAVGLAAELAAQGVEVLLVDADPYGASVGQHLGVLDEASGLLAAARAANTGRLDAQRLASYARQVAPRLRVLSGLPRPDRWLEVRTLAFADLLEVAGELGSYVVVDVGFSIETEPVDPFGSSAPQRNQMTLTALERADEVLVVGAADPVGLARLARGLVDLHDLAPRLRPRVVVNRTRATLGWSDREIHAMVEGFVTPLGMHFLPDDRVAADRALMTGHSLVESGDSDLCAGLAAIATSVLGSGGPAPRSGLLRRRRAGRAR